MASNKLLIRDGQVYDHEGDVHKPAIADILIEDLDEDALRREVADLMRHFISDYDRVVESRKRALPHMLEAHRRVWQADIGMNRFIGRTR